MPLFALDTQDVVGVLFGVSIPAVAAMIVLFRRDRRADAEAAAAAWKAWGEAQAAAREVEGRAYRDRIAELEKQARLDARELGRLDEHDRTAGDHP